MKKELMLEYFNKHKELLDEFIEKLSPKEKFPVKSLLIDEKHEPYQYKGIVEIKGKQKKDTKWKVLKNYAVLSTFDLEQLKKVSDIKWFDNVEPEKREDYDLYESVHIEKENGKYYLNSHPTEQGSKDWGLVKCSKESFFNLCKSLVPKKEEITIIEDTDQINIWPKEWMDNMVLNKHGCLEYTEPKIQKKVCIAVEKSRNSKTGLVSATYMPIQSCPRTCPFLDKGCYAQTSHTGMKLIGLNKAAKERKLYKAVDLAIEEANAIDKLSGVNPLRLHIVGDCKTKEAVKILSAAAEKYMNKHNQPVWTYTHAWRNIPRDTWEHISVLASCETLDECKQAMKKGYAAAIVRLKPFDKSFRWEGLNMTACKEQTKGIKCKECQLCMNDKKLLQDNKVICFFPHGIKAGSIKKEILKKEGK